MNVHFDPQGCQTLLLKESELYFLSLGSWTIIKKFVYRLKYAKSFNICLNVRLLDFMFNKITNILSLKKGNLRNSSDATRHHSVDIRILSEMTFFFQIDYLIIVRYLGHDIEFGL